jgi:hypothetical protein
MTQFAPLEASLDLSAYVSNSLPSTAKKNLFPFSLMAGSGIVAEFCTHTALYYLSYDITQGRFSMLSLLTCFLNYLLSPLKTSKSGFHTKATKKPIGNFNEP